MRHGAALTFRRGSAAYAGMVPPRHLSLLRQCLAALLALGLLLNGMGGSLAAAGSRDGAATVVIAGTLVTVCQFDGGDPGDKVHGGHSCDQCALRLAPTLPPNPAVASLLRFPEAVQFGPRAMLAGPIREDHRPAWPRGPPRD